MIYKVKIRYWNGWAEDSAWIEKMVRGAKDYVHALQTVLNGTDLEDTDIEEIDVEAVYD